MSRLIRISGRKPWYFRAKVNGGQVTWSTGETDKRKAMAKLPELETRALLYRERFGVHSNDKRKLKCSIAADDEVQRIQSDISMRRADRVDFMLNNFLEWSGNDDLTLGEVTTEMLEQYQRARLNGTFKAGNCDTARPVSKYTVGAELTAIKAMLEQNGISIAKPKPKTGKTEIVRPFKDEELPLFFAHIAPEFKTLFLTMLATGARPTELIPSKRAEQGKPLLKSDVDFKKETVTIWTAKRKDLPPIERPVSVEPFLLERLREQIASAEKDYVYVFLPMSRLSRVFNKAVARVGSPNRDQRGAKLTAHSFRHTYATHHSSLGCNQFQLSAALGHTNLATTARYVHNQAPQIQLNLQTLINESSIPKESQAPGTTEPKVIDLRLEAPHNAANRLPESLVQKQKKKLLSDSQVITAVTPPARGVQMMKMIFLE